MTDQSTIINLEHEIHAASIGKHIKSRYAQG